MLQTVIQQQKVHICLAMVCGSVVYLIWLKLQYYLTGIFHFAEKQKKAKSLQAKKVCVFKWVFDF